MAEYKGDRGEGWHSLPATQGQNLTSAPFLKQFYSAYEERDSVIHGPNGILNFPPGNFAWYAATVESLTVNGDGTITTTCTNIPDGAWSGGIFGDRWHGYNNHFAPYIPSTYDFVVVGDPNDPFQLVRGTISGMTYTQGIAGAPGTGSLTFSDLNFLNAVTSHYIPSIDYLVGKPFQLLKAFDHFHRLERLPPLPNDEEAFRGTLNKGRFDETTGRGWFYQEFDDYNFSPYDTWQSNLILYGNENLPLSLTNDAFLDHEIVFRDIQGYLQREVVTGNSKNRLIVGECEMWVRVRGDDGTFSLALSGRAAAGITAVVAVDVSAGDLQAAIEGVTGFSGSVVTLDGDIYKIVFPLSVGVVTVSVDTDTTTSTDPDVTAGVTILDPYDGSSVDVVITGAPTGGYFTLTFSGGFTGTISITQGESASDVQDAIDLIAPAPGLVSVSGSYTFVFDPSLNIVHVAVPVNLLTGGTNPKVVARDPVTQNLPANKYVLMNTESGSLGRTDPDHQSWNVWTFYAGLGRAVFSHDERTDDLGTVTIPAGTVGWLEGVPGDVDNDCEVTSHLAWLVDTMIEYTNECESGRAGNFLARYFYCSWKVLQVWVENLAPNFVVPKSYANAKFVEYMYFARAMHYIDVNSWASSLTYVSGTMATVSVAIAPPFYPWDVSYVIEKEGSHGNDTSIAGAGILLDDTTLLGSFSEDDDTDTIIMTYGFTKWIPREIEHPFYPITRAIPDCGPDGCIDPFVITPDATLGQVEEVTLSVDHLGGTLTHNTTYGYRVTAYNQTGETKGSDEVTILTKYVDITAGNPGDPSSTPGVPYLGNTFKVTIDWKRKIGAKGYRVWGRMPSGEGLLIDIADDSVTTYTDAGTPPTPTGTVPESDTTNSDCNGVGIWIYRGLSTTNYKEFGEFGLAGGGEEVKDGDLVRYIGDGHFDPFTGRGVVPEGVVPIDLQYWHKFFRGRFTFEEEKRRAQSRLIVSPSARGRYYIQDPTRTWWNNVYDVGTMRMQGGVATGGTGTTLETDSPGGSELCWFASTRFDGENIFTQEAVTSFEMFTLEIYPERTPPGFTTADDGSTIFSDVSPSNDGTVTFSQPPVYNSTYPEHPLANGLPVVFHIYGDNFQMAGLLKPLVTLINERTGQNIIATVTTVTAGYLTVTANLGRGNDTWDIYVKNPDGQIDSGSFDVQAMYKFPITQSDYNAITHKRTLSFDSPEDFAVSSGDFFIIREPRYQLNCWSNRYVKLFSASPGFPKFVKIKYNDETTIFWDALDDPLPDDATAQIIEYEVGEVWRLQFSRPDDSSLVEGLDYINPYPNRFYVIPVGDDPERALAPGLATFLEDRRYNLPTYVKRYGTFNIGDNFGVHIPNELYALLNVLIHTLTRGGYRSNHDIGTDERYAFTTDTSHNSAAFDLHNPDRGVFHHQPTTLDPDDGIDGTTSGEADGDLNARIGLMLGLADDNYLYSTGQVATQPHKLADWGTYIQDDLSYHFISSPHNLDGHLRGGGESTAVQMETGYIYTDDVPDVFTPLVDTYIFATIRADDPDESVTDTDEVEGIPFYGQPGSGVFEDTVGFASTKTYVKFDAGDSGLALTFRRLGVVGSDERPDGHHFVSDVQVGKLSENIPRPIWNQPPSTAETDYYYYSAGETGWYAYGQGFVIYKWNNDEGFSYVA